MRAEQRGQTCLLSATPLLRRPKVLLVQLQTVALQVHTAVCVQFFSTRPPPPQSLFCMVAFKQFSHTHLGSTLHGLVEPHQVYVGPALNPIQVPLAGVPSFYCTNCTAQLGAISKVLRMHSVPSSMLLVKVLRSTDPC